MNTNKRVNTLMIFIIVLMLVVRCSTAANMILQETNKEKCINEHKAANEKSLKAAQDYLDKQTEAYEQARIDYRNVVRDYERVQQEIMAFPPKYYCENIDD